MIDSHSHLYFDWYDEDREEVYRRMLNAGVKATVSVGIDPESCRKVEKQIREKSFIFGAFGIHPTESEGIGQGDIAELGKMFGENPKSVAVGEVGLDYYHKNVSPKIQQEMFREMIRLAGRVKKPLIIHNREADEDCYRIIVEEKAREVRGVFHCFAGDVEMARRVLDEGFYISFTGNVTFKNFKQSDVVAFVPPDRLLLETDSPFLTPVPYRGKRNEPAYLPYVAEKIAEIKGMEKEILIEQTDKNVAELFSLGAVGG